MGIIGITEAGLVLSDNTTANASTTKHGLAPKYPNDATKYLDGTGAYSVPAGGGGTGLTAVSVQSGAYTAAASALVPVDANAASGNFAVSLPASPSNGDRVGVLMVAQHATRKVTVSLNGGSFVGTIGYYDLILDGDLVVFQYDSTLAKWFVDVDGIQPHVCRLKATSDQTSLGNSTHTKVNLDTSDIDIGGIGDVASNDRITFRRAGNYLINGQAWVQGNYASAALIQCAVRLNGDNDLNLAACYLAQGAYDTTNWIGTPTKLRTFSSGDYIEGTVYVAFSGTSFLINNTSVTEARAVLCAMEIRP